MKNEKYFFMHPNTGKICEIYNGRSMWEDHIDKADWVVIKVLGPALDHYDEAMNYGKIENRFQPKEMDFSKYKNELPYGEIGSKERAAWSAREQTIANHFYHDSLEATGLTGHVRASQAFSLAWERGHSTGLQDIFYNLQDLANLIRGVS
jgi:hypothetical protein